MRTYDGAYAERVAKARQMATKNARLTYQIQENLLRATRNRYNLEVLLSLAALTGHHNRLLIGMKAIEDRLAAARKAAQSGTAVQAVEALVQAYRKAGQIVADRREAFAALTATWEQSRYPKGQSLTGSISTMSSMT